MQLIIYSIIVLCATMIGAITGLGVVELSSNLPLMLWEWKRRVRLACILRWQSLQCA